MKTILSFIAALQAFALFVYLKLLHYIFVYSCLINPRDKLKKEGSKISHNHILYLNNYTLQNTRPMC